MSKSWEKTILHMNLETTNRLINTYTLYIQKFGNNENCREMVFDRRKKLEDLIVRKNELLT